MGGLNTLPEVAPTRLAEQSSVMPQPSVANVVPSQNLSETSKKNMKAKLIEHESKKSQKASSPAATHDNSSESKNSSNIQQNKLEQRPVDVAGAQSEYESLKKSALKMFTKVTSPKPDTKKCRRKKRKSTGATSHERKLGQLQYFRRKNPRRKAALNQNKLEIKSAESTRATPNTPKTKALDNSRSSTFSSTDFSVDSGKESIKSGEDSTENSANMSQGENSFVEPEVKLIKPCYATSLSQADFFSALNREIEAEASACDIYMASIKPFCYSIKEKLEKLARKTFRHNVKAYIYGSIATSLALPESDLDLMICGLRLYSKEGVVNAVQEFSEAISTLDFVISCQSITSARVPVIKMVVELSKLSSTAVKSRKLHVDVTFETQGDYFLPAPHPVLCADLIKYRCHTLPYLKPMTILLKKLIKSAGLNNPFLGDISSYVLNLMVSAFLRMCHNSPSPAECFMETLRYYANEFKSDQMMVVQGDYVMLMPVQVLKGRLVVTDPFRPAVNAAANVTRFDRLQECAREAWETMVRMRDEYKGEEAEGILQKIFGKQ